jgi:hypothetical protein
VRHTKQADSEYENLLSCYPEHAEEHLQKSVLDVKESSEELTKTNENYFCALPSSSKRNLELNLKISDISKTRRTERRKRVMKGDKTETNSFYKASEMTISKARKRKGKLRSSASKSTIATKELNSGKKEAKRRKYKGRIVFIWRTNHYRVQSYLVYTISYFLLFNYIIVYYYI